MANAALSRADSPQTAPRNNSQAPTYRKLNKPKSQIRVLRLLPGDTDTIIHAEFVHIDLNNSSHLNYEALSYVWSLLTGERDVEIDNRICSITASAENVLRNVQFKNSSRVVWIDAVCINQKDITEKQHQIPIMGNIYSKAERTVIWLGEQDGYTKLTIDTLRLIYNQASQNSEGFTQLRNVLYGKARVSQYSTTPLPDDCTSDAMEAVRQLFERSWFRRRWIIQEAVLAPEGVVCCGTQSMPALELFRAAVWLGHKEDYLPFDLQQEVGMLNASYMSSVIDSEQGWFSQSSGQKQKLADLFRFFQTFDTTHIDQQPFPAQIIPAYERPINEVLADATRVATDEAGDLWLFRYIDLPELPRSSHPPTWVPQLFRNVDPAVDPNRFRSTFNASEGMTTSYPELSKTFDLSPQGHDWSTISAQSFIVDRIQDLGRVITKSDLCSTEAIHRLRRGRRKTPTSSSNRPRPVLLAGTHFDPEPVVTLHESAQTFEAFVKILCLAEVDGGRKTTTLIKSKAYARCIRGVKWAAANRRLFITADGRFGLGPRATSKDQVLVVLSASRMPMIMRQSGHRWQVVGPCYVQGIMKGKAVEHWKVSGDSLLTFLLH